MKLIGNIGGAILVFFGVLFVWGAFSPDGSGTWILIGIISLLAGFGLLFLANRPKPAAPGSGPNVTYKVDLPADVNLDQLKCKSCGGALTTDNVKMVAGAPVVTCPYCGTSYQLTEEPKW